jgi:hypothetical protein
MVDAVTSQLSNTKLGYDMDRLLLLFISFTQLAL